MEDLKWFVYIDRNTIVPIDIKVSSLNFAFLDNI